MVFSMSHKSQIHQNPFSVRENDIVALKNEIMRMMVIIEVH